MTYVPWEQAWRTALYGDGGFFHRPEGPSGHFRTSATSRVFAAAMHRLAAEVDRALGHPDDFTFVDVGAGRGELLRLLAEHVPDRWRLLAVEVAARPDRPRRSHRVVRRPQLPGDRSRPGPRAARRGALCDRRVPSRRRTRGRPRRSGDGRGGAGCSRRRPRTRTGSPRWWPISEPGQRAEVGRTRDEVWRGLVDSVAAGLVVAVDYDHAREDREELRHGTLAAYRDGHLVPPVPDGTCDLTAHVALDACAAATPEGGWTRVVRQADALASLGVTSTLPDPELAGHDPKAYAEALATAAESRVLLDPSGISLHQQLRRQAQGVDAL